MRFKSRMLSTSLMVNFVLFSMVAPAQEKEVLDTHFDIVQKFSTIFSKSRQLVLMSQKSMEGSPAIDSAKLIYMDLKASSDGAIARYKSMIDNPAKAKKTGQTLKESINEVTGHLNNFTRYVAENAKTGLGYNPIAGLTALATITDLGKDLYSEIKAMQKAKREETKAEINQYALLDWDAVK